ncbi:hypothetical protein [Streptomyces sp. NPDC056982]|uniref:hypothetical protein n=1 Tax=Streptomyces sp. NPDC056982 TaxID=3345986 RepID=UPI00363B4DC1
MATEQPDPIRKGELPCIPAPEWEFHTWFAHPDGGGDLVPGQHARGVQVRRRVTYGSWEPVHPDHWAEELPSDAGLAAAPSAAAGQAIDWKAKYEAEHARHVAVVSSLVADRPAVLREAANGLAALGPVDSLVSAPAAWTEVIETLRRMADQIAEDDRRKANEAQQEADHA